MEENFSEIKTNISTIFIDPPYKLNKFDVILDNLHNSNLISKNTLIVIETNKETLINVPDYLNIFDERVYGKTKYLS